MRPDNITQIVRLSGLVVAMFIAVSTPLTFGLVSYREVIDDLNSRASRSAERASRQIAADEQNWLAHGESLQEALRLIGTEKHLYRQFVRTLEGREVMSDPRVLPWPRLFVVEPLVVSGRHVGSLEMETSLRPLALDMAWITLMSLLAGALSYFLVHRWPLRMIARAVAALEDEQRRSAKALAGLRASDDALKARTRQLVDAQRLGLIGDWRFDIPTRAFFLSPVAMELLRLDPRQFLPTHDNLKQSVLGDGSQKIDRLITDVLRTRQTRSTDVQFRRGDGTIAHLAFACGHVEDENGTITEIVGTLQDVTERRESQKQLERLAYFDPLTDLANRSMFKRRLEDLLEQGTGHGSGKDNGRVAALLLLDLDRFKEVNDSLGHAAGDELLQQVAARLCDRVDCRHVIARLGGDAFAVLITVEGTSIALAGATAQHIVDQLALPFRIAQGEVRVGASIGIVMLPRDGSTSDELIKHADLALYRAKEKGRGRYAFFERAMSDSIQQRMLLANDLRAAVTQGSGLEAWLQPQIELASGRVVGFEALMRWRHPVRGLVPPAEFIPIAEGSSLICDIGHWMMLESARMAKRWIDQGRAPYEVAVNLSASQVWQCDIVRNVTAILEETGLPPHLLCVELTESMLADHSEGRVRRTLAALKALGVKLALDDFGTGYSSLGYLVQLSFDKLKIDRLFIDGAARSEKMQHVLKGIIALGHGLGMTVVAEGVEQPDDLVLLRLLGCDQVQGYIFARPQPETEALAYAGLSELRKRNVA
jgi:diguanylate cyclase (GGDEF)-like protein